jgi:hypothetical protein
MGGIGCIIRMVIGGLYRTLFLIFSWPVALSRTLEYPFPPLCLTRLHFSVPAISPHVLFSITCCRAEPCLRTLFSAFYFVGASGAASFLPGLCGWVRTLYDGLEGFWHGKEEI